MKRVISFLLILVFVFQLAGCGAIDTAKSAAGKAGEKAGQLAQNAAEGFENAVDVASEAVSQLSFPDFKKGFETAAGYFEATIASLGGQSYVDSVADAISELQQRITSRVSVNGDIASQAGFAAEEWHAGTYNIDAVASGKKPNANTPQSNKLGSADIKAGNTEAGVKYYSKPSASAIQQAKSWLDRYKEYAAKSDNPKSPDQWLADNGISEKTNADLYYAIYQDQLRIIPSDQLEGAREHLKKAIAKAKSQGTAEHQLEAKNYEETLEKLTDRLKTADGTESIPLSKKEAEALVKATRNGDLDEQFLKKNVTLNSRITGSYIAKQALKSGATSAIIQAAIVLGPEIYEIIKLGIENGELNEEELKNAGIDGLSAAADGYLKGSISNALLIMSKAGKLGADYASASPELVGTLTVLVIDAVKYGVMLANGEIPTDQYLDTMAEELFVSIGSAGAATLVGALIPGATLAIMLGSFVGGIVASAGYTTGKTFALALIDEYEVDLLVPIKNTSNTIKDLASTVSIKVTDAIAGMKAVKDDAYKKITIMVYDLTERS